MPLPISKSQITRLGERLVRTAEPTDEDLTTLSDLLIAYDDLLAAAMETVRDLGFDPTGRVKNTGTILEKLARHGGSWLKSIQDLAGMRIVVEDGRPAQDAAVEKIIAAFGGLEREAKIIDRRLNPSEGYRAVHVIIYPDGIPVEIQIRTRWQHEWADMFEKLADLIGRGIRYGEPPAHWWEAIEPQVVAQPPEKVATLRPLYEMSYKVHELMARSAVALSDLIDALETLEADGVPQDDPALQEMWADVQNDLVEFRERMKGMTPVSARLSLDSLSS